MNKINVLGTKYTIERRLIDNDKNLETCDGYCDTSIKLIVIVDAKPETHSKADLEAYAKKVIRHEIIHAFLYESGLCVNAVVFDDAWSGNEEMIDWIAIQFPKLLDAFRDADAL